MAMAETNGFSVTSAQLGPSAPAAEVRETSCVVVGAGPAGAVLALLLARAGVDVVLLESHGDFDRDFRGDTVHPSILEVMAEIGLAERLHRLPHAKVPAIPLETPDGSALPGDLRHLRGPYRYIMMVEQARFLRFLTDEAGRYPTFTLEMNARVQRLVHRDGRVAGVRFRRGDTWQEVRAGLVVGADGRHSKVRNLAEVPIARRDLPFDSVWFRVPVSPGDPNRSFGRVTASGASGAVLRREEHWQIAVNIPKSSFPALKAEGVHEFRRIAAELVPELAHNLVALKDWRQTSLLSVWTGRLRRWYLPGLLFIGDAAHVMSPAFGVGISYAVQDAVVAANVLTRPLRAYARTGEPVPDAALRAVQVRREVPTRFVQALQDGMERRRSGHEKRQAASSAGAPKSAVVPSRALRTMNLPVVREGLAHLLGIGLWRVHVRNTAG